MNELYSSWVETKQKLDSLKKDLLEIEKKIYLANEEAVMAKGLGTTSVETDMFKVKITTKETMSWDQDKLKLLGHLPFKTEFKIGKAELGALASVNQDMYNKVLDCCITKAAKPAFKVELKDGN